MGQPEQKAQVWLVWLIGVLVPLITPVPGDMAVNGTSEVGQAGRVGSGVVIAGAVSRQLFAWLPGYRWHKLALKAYQQGRQAYRRAWYRYQVADGLARLAQRGVLSLAWVLDRLTQSQMRRYLGALPVLYTVLKELQVAETINQYCASRSEVSHGTVAVVLVLNRLHAPRALWRVADWLGQTVLGSVLGVEAAKFNKDRLARTLAALAPQGQAIWQALVSRAIERYQIDLSVIYYDLTALIGHGEYQESDLIRYGFAHNTVVIKNMLKLIKRQDNNELTKLTDKTG
jgi:hypothetical protein